MKPIQPTTDSPLLSRDSSATSSSRRSFCPPPPTTSLEGDPTGSRVPSSSSSSSTSRSLHSSTIASSRRPPPPLLPPSSPIAGGSVDDGAVQSSGSNRQALPPRRSSPSPSAIPPPIIFTSVYRLHLSRDRRGGNSGLDDAEDEADDMRQDYGYLIVRLLPSNRGQVLHGLDVAVRQMTIGETAQVKTRFDYAYGHYCLGASIPPRANLFFTVQLLDINGSGADQFSVISRLVRRVYRLLRNCYRHIGPLLASCLLLCFGYLLIKLGLRAEEELNIQKKNKRRHDDDEDSNADSQLEDDEEDGEKQPNEDDKSSEDDGSQQDDSLYDEEEEEEGEMDGTNQQGYAASSRRRTTKATANREGADRKRTMRQLIKPDPRVKRYLSPSVRVGGNLLLGRKLPDYKTQKLQLVQQSPKKDSKSTKTSSKKMLRSNTEKLDALQELIDEEEGSKSSEDESGDEEA